MIPHSFTKHFHWGPVGVKTFPRQIWLVQKRVKVCFNDDIKITAMATIIRADEGENAITILLLDDGRYVLGSEVTYAT